MTSWLLERYSSSGGHLGKMAGILPKLPAVLEDRAEIEAAKIAREILSIPKLELEIFWALSRYGVQHASSHVRQGDVAELCEKAAKIHSAIQDFIFYEQKIQIGLEAIQKVQTKIDVSGLNSSAFAAADAATDLVVRTLEINALVLEAFGEDKGSHPISKVHFSPIEAFGVALARVWKSKGYGLNSHDGGKPFVAMLRTLNEMITGEEDIKNEARVIAHIRRSV